MTSGRGVIKALVWNGGHDFTLESFPRPDLASGDMLVRVSMAAICGSDRHTVSGIRSQPCPSILGHEGVGVVEDVAGDAAAKVGERIVWSVTSPCWGCDRCRRGLTAKCRTVTKAGHETLAGQWPFSGSYASHILIPAGHPVVVVPADVEDAAAAIAACAGATVMAVIEAAYRGLTGALSVGSGGVDVCPSLEEDSVLVVGAGMLGLLAVMAAREAGARSITVVEPDEARRSLAELAGADRVCSPGELNLGTFDVVLEFSGAAAAISAGLTSVATGGVMVLAGSVYPGPPVEVIPEAITRGWHTITGVHNYESRHLVAALRLFGTPAAKCVFASDGVLAGPVGLEDVPEVFRNAPWGLRTLVGRRGRLNVSS